jgi:hypothetical protein
MGSGISLNKNQIIHIIKRDIKKSFYDDQSKRIRYTDDGYEIFYDFSDEVLYMNKLKEIDRFNEFIDLHKDTLKK